MNRKIIVTGDNSKSLLIPEMNETYHSIHGAKNESEHIFIQTGLKPQLANTEVRILEMGFGTGLNALLTLACANDKITPIIYDTFENYPIDLETITEIDHPRQTNLEQFRTQFEMLHTLPWNESKQVTTNFNFTKYHYDFLNAELKTDYYTLIYYDAFAPQFQPDLWDYPIMQKLYHALQHSGTLVTYCAQGQFRRNLRQAGFTVHKVPGPKGKREITLATK
jgi:tRNA U34 5-methylaminomethyl-2-thiouridine-forming methyltransferase MnmC